MDIRITPSANRRYTNKNVPNGRVLPKLHAVRMWRKGATWEDIAAHFGVHILTAHRMVRTGLGLAHGVPFPVRSQTTPADTLLAACDS